MLFASVVLAELFKPQENGMKPNSLNVDQCTNTMIPGTLNDREVCVCDVTNGYKYIDLLQKICVKDCGEMEGWENPKNDQEYCICKEGLFLKDGKCIKDCGDLLPNYVSRICDMSCLGYQINPYAPFTFAFRSLDDKSCVAKCPDGQYNTFRYVYFEEPKENEATKYEYELKCVSDITGYKRVVQNIVPVILYSTFCDNYGAYPFYSDACAVECDLIKEALTTLVPGETGSQECTCNAAEGFKYISPAYDACVKDCGEFANAENPVEDFKQCLCKEGFENKLGKCVKKQANKQLVIGLAVGIPVAVVVIVAVVLTVVFVKKAKAPKKQDVELKAGATREDATEVQ